MKTSKEKAIELVTSFMPYSLSYKDNYAAKQCALIAVDEMVSLGSMVGNNLSDSFYIYWQEVKEEINKL